MPDTKYVADIYLRLSKDDGDKEESDSIGNQRSLILDFLKSMPEITVHRIRIDDGFSGVDFNRPDFIKMIDDIEAGIVNCVIVKDFSRFGRNYIETGKYIQVLFPRSGVRFIAVNDAYDSAKMSGYASTIIVPFKNMVNDAYCADISVKVRSHLDIKRKKGDFVGAFAVYGYAKDEKLKNRLVIDAFAADVVRDIFKWKLEGISADGIAEKLNCCGILSPLEYKRFLGLRYNTPFKVNATAKWTAKAVSRILTNAVYTGVLEQGKRTKPNYKARVCAEVPKEKWISKEDTHEAIIERSMFDSVQGLLKRDTRAVTKGGIVYPLSGVIICGDCGAAMVRKTNMKNGRKYPYYVCSKHRADKNVCGTHIISFTDCENAVLCALRFHASSVVDVDKAISHTGDTANNQTHVRKLSARLDTKQDEIKKYFRFRLSLHESYAEGVISKEDFISFKASYDVKIADAESAVHLLKEEIERLVAGDAGNQSRIDKFKAFINAKTLERRAVVELIDFVKVYADSRVEIVFRYQNEYELLRAPAKSGGSAGEGEAAKRHEPSCLRGSEYDAVSNDVEAV